MIWQKNTLPNQRDYVAKYKAKCKATMQRKMQSKTPSGMQCQIQRGNTKEMQSKYEVNSKQMQSIMLSTVQNTKHIQSNGNTRCKATKQSYNTNANAKGIAQQTHTHSSLPSPIQSRHKIYMILQINILNNNNTFLGIPGDQKSITFSDYESATHIYLGF